MWAEPVPSRTEDNHLNRNVAMLSACFALIFFAWNGVQQFVMSFFQASGLTSLGFNALILIYAFQALSDPLSAVIVSKYGAKRTMMIGSIFYALFLALLPSRVTYAIYAGAAALGVGAAVLWNGQNSYLTRASRDDRYGTSAGIFTTAQYSATSLGILTLGFLIPSLSFSVSFLAFAAIPLMGTLLFLRLKDLRGVEGRDHFRELGKALSSPTALKMSTTWLVSSFAYGMAISIVPMELSAAIGIRYTGILFALFFILPSLISFFFGRLSDITGRIVLLATAYALLLAGLVLLSLSQVALVLVLGALMLVFNYAAIQTATFALVGDLSTSKNLESLTALFWTAKSTGVLTALILSKSLMRQPAFLYSISIGVVLVSSVIVAPLLRSGLGSVRARISDECR